MPWEKPATVGSDELNQPNAVASIDAAIVRLLTLFPAARPVLIPIHVGLPERSNGAGEEAVIVYRGSDTAIFLLDYPLLGSDMVKMRSTGGSRFVLARVVALMPAGRGSAVAVRFIEEVPKWLFKVAPHSSSGIRGWR